MQRCYYKSYQSTHDIDWFARYKGIPLHFASNGGSIPNQIKRKQNQMVLSRIVSGECPNNEVEINEIWMKEKENALSEIERLYFNRESYLESFLYFASRGFVSIDNAIIEDEFVYKIVAYPKNKSDLFKQYELPCIEDELKNIEINLWKE